LFFRHRFRARHGRRRSRRRRRRRRIRRRRRRGRGGRGRGSGSFHRGGRSGRGRRVLSGSVVTVDDRQLTAVTVVVLGSRDLHGRHHFRLEASVLDVNDLGARRLGRRISADPVGHGARRLLLLLLQYVPRLPAAAVVVVVLRVVERRRPSRLHHRRLDVVRPRHRILGRPHRMAGPERRHRLVLLARGRLRVLVVFDADHVVAFAAAAVIR